MDIDGVSAITIAVRVCPNLKETKSTITVIDSETPVLVVSDKRNAFAFDHIFSGNAQQCEIYNIMLKPMIPKVVSGYNSTVLAYGQTGTGKTYTIGTDSERYNDNNSGLIPRVLYDLLEVSSDSNISLSISFIEIYNEKVFDLLSPKRIELIVKGFEIKNLSPVKIETMYDAQHWLQIGGKNRHVRFTSMNATSSRSHAIFTVYCKRNDSRTVSKLHLIDLAGSESVKRTGNIGTPLKEGVTINKGLLTLGKVIRALSDRNHIRIPYRDSILTRILQDSLNINNFVSLLVCVSPSESDISETVNTLRFANEAKLLKSKPKLESIIAEYDRDHPGILGIIEPLTTVNKSRIRPKMYSSTTIKRPKFNIQNRQTIGSPPYSSTLDSLSAHHSSTIDVSQQINVSPIVRQFKHILDNTMVQVNEKNITKKEDKENAVPIVVQCKLDDNQMNQIIEQLTMNITNFNTTTKISSPIIRQQLNFDSPSESPLSVPFKTEFKIPVIPAMKQIKLNHVYNNSSPISSISNSVPRRSKRLSTFSLPEVPQMQSLRSCFLDLPPKPAPRYTMSNQIVNKNIRSLTDSIKPIRRSTRISMNLMNSTPKCCKVKPMPAPRTIKSSRVKLTKTSKRKSLSPLTKLRDEVLYILNFGDQKDIQKLQTVGPKTAAQILTYRQLNKEFTSFEDLKRIPTWKAKRFDNFMMANQLL